MRATITSRAAVQALVLAVAITLAGCTSAPTPTPPESGSPASPSATPSPEPSTTPAPPASPSPAPPAASAISDEEIMTLCASRAPGSDRTTRVVHFDQARLEQRPVDPPLFVYIPVTDNDPTLAFSDMSYYCLMTGTTADRAVGSFGATNTTVMTEEQIQQLIAENQPSDY